MRLQPAWRVTVATLAFATLAVATAYAQTQYDPDRRRTTSTCQECDNRHSECLGICSTNDTWCMIEIPNATPALCLKMFQDCVNDCDAHLKECKAKCK
jgi:hypothetical protein